MTTVTLRDIYPTDWKSYVYMKIFRQMFIAALFGRKLEVTKISLVDEWMSRQ